MDVWLPAEAEIAVKPGQNVKGGVSPLARMPKSSTVRNFPDGGGVRGANTKVQGGESS
jgi:hypothetical protein